MQSFSLFSLHIWHSCGSRSEQEPRCHHMAWGVHAAWDASASPRLQRSAKALSTHTHHGGLLLKSGGGLRREVIVRSDSGGRCQASFRIRSLRSSCCIFYWGNKRTARYFHTRAISLRAAAKETRWGQESVEEKQNSSFRKPKRLNAQPSAAASPCHVFRGQNPPQMDPPESICNLLLQTNQWVISIFMSEENPHQLKNQARPCTLIQSELCLIKKSLKHKL